MRLSVLVAIVLLATAGVGRAQDLVAVERPASDESCTLAMGRTQDLLREGQHVDAHLLAQTMSFLCLSSSAAWNILDAIALTHLEEHQRAHALLESLALRPGPLAARAEVLAAWVLVHGNLGGAPNTGRLAPHDAAYICTFECTFCVECAEGVLAGTCPNCGGNFSPRPIRPSHLLGRYPASVKRVVKAGGCAAA